MKTEIVSQVALTYYIICDNVVTNTISTKISCALNSITLKGMNMSMEQEKYFEATEFENVKDLIYYTVEKYKDHIAFVIKHKENKEITYENITYGKFLEDINALGSSFLKKGYQDKRIAIVGRNRYEWALTHLTNQ